MTTKVRRRQEGGYYDVVYCGTTVATIHRSTYGGAHWVLQHATGRIDRFATFVEAKDEAMKLTG